MKVIPYYLYEPIKKQKSKQKEREIISLQALFMWFCIYLYAYTILYLLLLISNTPLLTKCIFGTQYIWITPFQLPTNLLAFKRCASTPIHSNKVNFISITSQMNSLALKCVWVITQIRFFFIQIIFLKILTPPNFLNKLLNIQNFQIIFFWSLNTLKVLK